MGSNKTFKQKYGNRVVLGESDEFRRLRHAVEKAAGDRDRAIRYVCHLYGVKTLDALPGGSGRRRWRYLVRKPKSSSGSDAQLAGEEAASTKQLHAVESKASRHSF
jgi:hypothetical protein